MSREDSSPIKNRAGGLTGPRKTFGGEADPHSGGTDYQAGLALAVNVSLPSFLELREK